MIRRVAYYQLPVRDTDIGHWRFNGTLEAEAGPALHAQNIAAGDYVAGYAEPGVTAVSFFGAAKRAFLAAAQAGVFDFGLAGFSIGLLVRFADVTAHTIIRKGTLGGGVTGWHVSGDTSGKLILILGDGTNFTSCISSKTVADNRWHYCEVVCDRTADQVRLYVDGVLDVASPHDISVVTGSLSAPASDLELGLTFEGLLDEVSICSEVLTASVVADRVKARFSESGPEDPSFLHSFLPGTNSDNAELNQFLIPWNDQYLEIREHASFLKSLVSPHECPARFLPLLASTFGFELPEAGIATESERRQLLLNAAWIYQRKGTRAAVEKIIDLLGFANNWAVVYPTAFPLISNEGTTWLLSAAVTDLFADDFSGTLGKWLLPSNPASQWKIQSGRLIGKGSGVSADTNALTASQNATNYHLQVDFEVVALSSFPQTEFGVYLRYVDNSNWMRIRCEIVSSVSRITIEREVAGVYTEQELVDLTGQVDLRTGVYQLHVHANHTTGRYTVALDDITYTYNLSFSGGGVGSTRKGLWVNHDAQVAFDDFVIHQVDHAEVASIYSDTFGQTTVQIGLADNSHPAFEAAKEQYLKEIVPKYLPADVGVQWVFWAGPPPS